MILNVGDLANYWYYGRSFFFVMDFMANNSNTVISAQPDADITAAQWRWMPSPWLMWGIAVLFVFFQFFMQLSSGVMLGQLVLSFHTNALGAGILAGSFYVVYTLLQTPAGMMVDRYGPRRLMTGGGVVCAVGAWLFASSQTLAVAELGRILMGGGSSFAFVSSLYIAAEWFPANRFGFMVGLAETIGMFGTLVGNVYLAHLLQTVPWRQTMYVASGVAVIIGLLCWILIRDTKPNHKHHESQTFKDFIGDIFSVLRKPALWVNGFISGIFFSLLTVFAGLWYIPFLVTIYHVPLTTATLAASMLYIGVATGGPLLGILYPRISRPRWLLFVNNLIAAFLVVVLVYFPPQHLFFTGVLMYLLGLISCSYVINFALVKELTPPSVLSTSVGFTNMVCVITAPILQPLIGWMISYIAMHEAGGPTTVYSINSFHWAFSIFPLLLILGAFLSRRIPRDKSQLK